jgi:hypothetical protein
MPGGKTKHVYAVAKTIVDWYSFRVLLPYVYQQTGDRQQITDGRRRVRDISGVMPSRNIVGYRLFVLLVELGRVARVLKTHV